MDKALPTIQFYFTLVWLRLLSTGGVPATRWLNCPFHVLCLLVYLQQGVPCIQWITFMLVMHSFQLSYHAAWFNASGNISPSLRMLDNAEKEILPGYLFAHQVSSCVQVIYDFYVILPLLDSRLLPSAAVLIFPFAFAWHIILLEWLMHGCVSTVASHSYTNIELSASISRYLCAVRCYPDIMYNWIACVMYWDYAWVS